ncbi:RES domain-containing protein [Sinorhizobium meliloti]|nr:RES domain-containing protein [Sinorhizobium meliloti]RVL16426.1 RES domain-containing protein [Sinorhizobium meliloti]RVP31659.1 RES domain-containing protein [Sinorhizobium meliloti]
MSTCTARAFQSEGKLRSALLRPDKELGPPPSTFAASGRMNAKGIAVFYGATDPETAVAEVRPPVGCEVAIARFRVVRSLRLLDLTAPARVTAAGSVFDPEYANTLSRMMFLRSLSRRMARPVMPDDQDSDYLPTQAIADFLATDAVMSLDGIIFPSVQVAGGKQNVVLFHKASLVEKLVIPPGAETDVETYDMDDDGPYRNYKVVWRLKSEEKTKDGEHGESTNFFDTPFDPPSAADDDMDFGSGREVTLKITPKDLEVQIVNAVVFDTEDYKVDHLSYTPGRTLRLLAKPRVREPAAFGQERRPVGKTSQINRRNQQSGSTRRTSPLASTPAHIPRGQTTTRTFNREPLFSMSFSMAAGLRHSPNGSKITQIRISTFGMLPYLPTSISSSSTTFLCPRPLRVILASTTIRWGGR